MKSDNNLPIMTCPLRDHNSRAKAISITPDISTIAFLNGNALGTILRKIVSP